MKVCVITGSPKGKNSVTYQTVRYLEKKNPRDEFEVIHAGRFVRKYERDLAPIIESMQAADLVLFCYPVYTFEVPYQLHRLIEHLSEEGFNAQGKPAAQILTSKHFYDVTAMRFIRESCDELGFAYFGELSEDMEDLLTEKGRREAQAFWDLIRWRMENNRPLPRLAKDPAPLTPYEPVARHQAQESIVRPTDRIYEVAVVADLREEDEDLARMIADFTSMFSGKVHLVNLREFPFAGGCMSCFNCATDGTCVYKDGFDTFLREEIQTADAIVYAFTVRNHSMGSQMKLYDDRQFCNGHRTVTAGKPTGYIVRGDMQAEQNLSMIIEGRANVGGNYLCGIATDALTLREMTDMLEYALRENLQQPMNFLGVGGTKIFRDLIWQMQGLMQADHKYYKEHGVYDFPQYDPATMLKMKLVGAMFANPQIRAKMGDKMTEGMVAPYEKVIEEADQEVS